MRSRLACAISNTNPATTEPPLRSLTASPCARAELVGLHELPCCVASRSTACAELVTLMSLAMAIKSSFSGLYVVGYVCVWCMHRQPRSQATMTPLFILPANPQSKPLLDSEVSVVYCGRNSRIDAVPRSRIDTGLRTLGDLHPTLFSPMSRIEYVKLPYTRPTGIIASFNAERGQASLD